jgi:hypothetical protein
LKRGEEVEEYEAGVGTRVKEGFEGSLITELLTALVEVKGLAEAIKEFSQAGRRTQEDSGKRSDTFSVSVVFL